MKYTMNIRMFYLSGMMVVIIPALTRAEQTEMYFNPALLEIGNPHQEKTDLSVFENGQQAPGKYRVDIYLNQEKVDTREVEFRLVELSSGEKTLQPCLTVTDLTTYGVKTERYPDLGINTTCADLSVIPNASTEFVFSNQKLTLNIPQMAVNAQARGTVPPEQWDNGINALLLNYSFSGDNTYAKNSNSQNSQSQYANLRPGVNLGPWRLRNYTTWSRDTDGRDQWDSVYTYLQRNIVPLKGVMTLGDSSSPSDVFDSVPFRGVQIASDDDMLADSMKGYAPVVRGIAKSNAQVTVRQNGYQIYQSYVPAGAFEITDMYPTGGSGDLNVTVKEADGSEQHFVVPFASLPVLQREGRFKYSLTGGQYRSYNTDVKKTDYVQGTGIYGLPFGITMYGGIQKANVYQALAFGLGTNLGELGALSADMTKAKASISSSDEEKGQSWRLRYSKNFVETGTNFAVAGYRYSTEGYYTLQETLDSWTSSNDSDSLNHPRVREELTLSQNLWKGAGNLSLSMVKEAYWNDAGNMRSYSVGYNNSWHGISYNISYSFNKNTSVSGNNDNSKTYDKDRMIALSVSVPLSNWLPESRTQVSYSANNSDSGGTTQNVSLSGTALDSNNLSWSVQQGYDNTDATTNGNLNVDYKGTYGEVTGGYSYDANSQQINYGLSGGVLVHNNGVTLSQPLGETVALVKAPGAQGVGVLNQTGVKTDYRGYAIVPYSSPYRRNTVTLDAETMPSDVDVSGMTQTVIPTRGAVVRAEFTASVGHRVLMTLLHQGNSPVPFGAMVTDISQKNAQSFIVGDNGQVYLTGLADTGSLTVKWGEGAQQQCQVNYIIPQTSPDADIQLITGKCQ
ncbi:fimbria/pilus outer membrane usher protein [Citrobacter amalonaticus]|nr:fimbria/pilus outer membrane usher protein [Citrobacter amalonaticus]MEC5724740.1 fimbria/pilus outer membrane usher protein [Citrobacter amalonaticus]